MSVGKKNWSAADKANIKKKNIFNMFDIKNVNPSFFLRTYISYNKIYKYKD